MTKQELIKELNDVYSKIESALQDESVMTVGKRIENLNDELGSIISGIEDEGIDLDNKEKED